MTCLAAVGAAESLIARDTLHHLTEGTAATQSVSRIEGINSSISDANKEFICQD